MEDIFCHRTIQKFNVDEIFNVQNFCYVLNNLRHVNVISDITKIKFEISYSHFFEKFSNIL